MTITCIAVSLIRQACILINELFINNIKRLNMMVKHMKHVMKILISSLSVCFCFFCVPFASYASTYSIFYGGTGHEEPVSVQATGDNGFIIASNSRSFGDENCVWVYKTDALGALEWQKVYRNAEKESYSVASIDTIPGGGYILAGSALTCYESEGASCQGYGWLARIDAGGNVVWQKGYKDTEGYLNSFSSVQTASDNGFIAVGRGRTQGTVTPWSNLWVVKTDSEGAVQWQFTYDNDNISDSYAHSVQQTQDGGYIVTGSLFSGITDWSYGYDLWVLKLNANGAVEWHGLYQGHTGNDIGMTVIQSSDGGYVIGGQTEDSEGYGSDGLVMKLDASGNIAWQKNYETNVGDSIKTIYQTDDGGFISGGLYQAGGVVLKIDNTGAIEWQKQYRSNAIVSMVPAANGVLMATGGSFTRDGISSCDTLLLKTDETGSINNCLYVTDADVQVYDAGLAVKNFTIMAEVLELRIIDTLTVPSDTGITPVEECPYKMLELMLSTSRVSVFSAPEGIQCIGTGCSGLYPGGTSVEITVYPETDNYLIAWGGDCECCGSNETCSIYMDADKSCIAVFAAQKGDIDADGITGLKDAIIALQVMAGEKTFTGIGYALSGADVNSNGKIEQAEAVYALQKEADSGASSAP